MSHAQPSPQVARSHQAFRPRQKRTCHVLFFYSNMGCQSPVAMCGARILALRLISTLAYPQFWQFKTAEFMRKLQPGDPFEIMSIASCRHLARRCDDPGCMKRGLRSASPAPQGAEAWPWNCARCRRTKDRFQSKSFRTNCRLSTSIPPTGNLG